jgi:predicted protein tyrosine phosphatase
MIENTLTAEIFAVTAPYANIYQSDQPRWLFVCSAGMLRSPTGAKVAANMGKNTRSCGTSTYALIPLSANLIMWADKIFFVNKENLYEARFVYKDTEYLNAINEKAVALDIPDIYEAYSPKLVEIFETVLQEYA